MKTMSQAEERDLFLNYLYRMHIHIVPEREMEFLQFLMWDFLPTIYKCDLINGLKCQEQFFIDSATKPKQKSICITFENTSRMPFMKQLRSCKMTHIIDILKKFDAWLDSDSVIEHHGADFQHVYSYEVMPQQHLIRNLPFISKSIEVRPEVENEFNDWYTEEFLPDLLAMNPSIEVCRRSRSVFLEKPQYFTFYYANCVDELVRAMDIMQRPYYKEFRERKRGALKDVTSEETLLLRPIYMRYRYFEGTRYPLNLDPPVESESGCK